MEPVRTLRRWGLLLAVAATSLSAPSAEAKSAKLRAVEVPKANFRAGPSTKADILFTATRYFPVQVLETKGDWVRVRDFEKEESWVAKRLLADVHTVAITVKKGNVRDEPSTKGEVADKVEYGEVFRVLARKGRWLKIATAKRTIGWVRDDLTWGERKS